MIGAFSCKPASYRGFQIIYQLKSVDLEVITLIGRQGRRATKKLLERILGKEYIISKLYKVGGEVMEFEPELYRRRDERFEGMFTNFEAELQTTEQSNKSFQRSEEYSKDRFPGEFPGLIPGMPDTITQSEIISKLRPKDLHSLSSVNRSWREAIHIQRREDYKATFGPQSTPIIGDIEAIALDSPRQSDRCFDRPASLPLLDKHILSKCESIPQPSEGSSRQKESVCPSVRQQSTLGGQQGKLFGEGNLLFERERRSAFLRDIQRHSYAAYIGHFPLLSYFAIAENESTGRMGYKLLQKMFLPCGLPPERED